MAGKETLGVIGLGAMGGPMCQNLIKGSGSSVTVFDLDSKKAQPHVALGARVGDSIADVVSSSDIVLLCLPGEPEVRQVCFGEGGVLGNAHHGQAVIDMTTATASIAREVGVALRELGVAFADAPVAKGVPSAVDGTLSIMVGADDSVFELIRPLLSSMGTDVTHCGEIGSGQVFKLMNNTMLFQTVSALAETLAIGTRAGVDGEKLFEVLSRGSADSFALRRHGSYMAKRVYPDNLFPAKYSLKDLRYALRLADEVGVDAAGAKLAAARLAEVIERGFGEQYSPVLFKLFDPD